MAFDIGVKILDVLPAFMLCVQLYGSWLEGQKYDIRWHHTERMMKLVDSLAYNGVKTSLFNTFRSLLWCLFGLRFGHFCAVGITKSNKMSLSSLFVCEQKK